MSMSTNLHAERDTEVRVSGLDARDTGWLTIGNLTPGGEVTIFAPFDPVDAVAFLDRLIVEATTLRERARDL